MPAATRTGKRKPRGGKTRAPAPSPVHPVRQLQDRAARVFACPRPPLNVSLVVDATLATGEAPQAIAARLGLPVATVEHFLLKAVLKLGSVLDLENRAPADFPGEAS